MTNVMAELMDEFQREKDCFSKAVNYQVEERWIYMEKLDCENLSHKKGEMIEPINLNFMYWKTFSCYNMI